MEPHDLLLSKLGAGREKDLDFAQAAVLSVAIQRDELLARLAAVTADPVVHRLIEGRIRTLFG